MSASVLGRCTLAALFAAAPASAAELRTCRVQALQGEAVSIGPAGTRPLVAGVALGAQARLRTGKAAWIDVLCSDKTRVTIGAETEIDTGSLVGESGASKPVAMRLDAGIARFLAPVRTWSSFRVRGPAAVASVRQTEWILEAPQDATHVFVVQGNVVVNAGAGGSLRLSAGQGVDVSAGASTRGDAPNGKLGERKAWGAERVDAALQRLGMR